jgi:hypothetical protein
LGEIFHTYPH